MTMNLLSLFIPRATLLAAGALFVNACDADDAEQTDDGGGECVGAKCDTPDDTTEVLCQKRQSEVIGSSNRGFTPQGIRWACADVEGVTANGHEDDDRGQEYCEYFAVINVPGADESLDFGRVLESRRDGNTTTELGLCIDSEVEGTSAEHCRSTITEEQFDQLAVDSDAVVGACVFTSWHADVTGPLPVCAGQESCALDHQGVSIPAHPDFMAMKGIFNNNGAAKSLVRDCANLAQSDSIPQPDFDDPNNPFNEPFYRGCVSTAGGAGVEWRRSDPSICAAVIRSVDCGCTAPGVTDNEQLGRAVVPAHTVDGQVAFRGFALGTWDDRNGLPPGCRFADIGEDGQTVVTCDLLGADLLSNMGDPKGACRSLYGNNIVVHVDLPVEALTCEATDKFGQACGDLPWNIGG
jgi:hypothetical protein